MAPKLRVSQEAFDAAVQENIDDFDMSPEEALKARPRGGGGGGCRRIERRRRG